MLIFGYVLIFLGLNTIACLISSFYRRKFERPSPNLSFILSLIFSALFLLFLLAGMMNNPATKTLSVLVLLGSAVLSAMSMIRLYFTMRSVGK